MPDATVIKLLGLAVVGIRYPIVACNSYLVAANIGFVSMILGNSAKLITIFEIHGGIYINIPGVTDNI